MDSRRPRLQISLVVFIDLLGFGILIPMLPFYVRHFGWGAFELGLLMSIYSVCQIFAAPIWGKLSDRFGRRPVLLITILGQGLSFLLAAFAWNYGLLFASRLLAGMFAGNISTASAYMADITTRETRAKGMGLIGAAFGLGFTLGPAISALVLPLGYAAPSLVAASLSFINLIGAFLYLKEPHRTEAERERRRSRWTWKSFQDLLYRPVTISIIFVFFLMTFAFVQLEVTIAMFVVDVFSFLESQAVLLLAGFGIVMAFVQGLAVGPMVARLGEPRLFLAGAIMMSLGLGGIVLSESVWQLLASLSVLAVGYSFSNPCLTSMLSKSVSDQEQGATLGIYHSGGSIARATAPILAGLGYEAQNRLPFLVATILIISVCLIWSWRFNLLTRQNSYDVQVSKVR
ncbi:MAG: MFS transporter [Bradymonadales bacterium]|nr:MAG: MFS transporter [Bradymonadales bacterium]